MRPPPFILVLKSNAPGSSETAITKGGRIMFREKKSGAEMENMAALWTSVFWSCPSPARAPQRRHPGLLGHGRPAVNRHTRCRTGAARRDFAPCPTGHRSFLFSIDKVGPGFCPEIMRKAGGGCAGDQTNAMLATSKEVILPSRTPALLLRPQTAQHGVSFALREFTRRTWKPPANRRTAPRQGQQGRPPGHPGYRHFRHGAAQ